MKNKKFKIFLVVIFSIIILFGVGGCKKTPPKPDDSGEDEPINNKEDEILVSAINENIQIKENKIKNYDYKSLFLIKVNNDFVEVLSDYISIKDINNQSKEVTCTYQNKSAKVFIEVLPLEYNLTLEKENVVLYTDEVSTYNFLALFKAYVESEEVPITDDMIESDVTNKPGTYSYRVSFHNCFQILTVKVEALNKVDLLNCYQTFTIEEDKVSEFDFTSLFTLYVDGLFKEVTSDMISLSNELPKAGEELAVTCTYSDDDLTVTKTISVNICSKAVPVITGQNINIYPNNEIIDLCSLFNITKNGESIPVTKDMISGEVDYNTEGTYEITLSFDGVTATAFVNVRRGVIINYAKSDTIVIQKGTNMATYYFDNDFKVFINGSIFTNVCDNYLDKSGLDFNTPGIYPCTLKIPYNDKKFGLSGPKFTTIEKTITYVVVANTYKVSFVNDEVTLNPGTTTYNPFSNINLYINGKNQSLTSNKAYVDAITCYAEVTSGEIDFSSIAKQTIVIDLYVNGPLEEPVTVSFDLFIKSDIRVEANNLVKFIGTNIYPLDLFTIYNGTSVIEVTNDMITGKIDCNKPGMYEVALNYEGLITYAHVTLIDNEMLGNYNTFQTTISSMTIEEETSEDEPEYVTEELDLNRLGSLVIKSLDNIVLNKKKLTIIDAIDESTFICMYTSNKYIMHYDNGIVFLDPDNSVKLGFNEYKRPLVYFNENMYSLDTTLSVGTSKNHVLTTSYICSTFDCFNVTDLNSKENKWYGLYVSLKEKTSSDTVYEVIFMEMDVDKNYKNEIDKTYSMTYDGESYDFTMIRSAYGKIAIKGAQKKYINRSFTGLINGEEAILKCTNYEGFNIIIDGYTYYDVPSLDNATSFELNIDYDQNIVTIRSYKEKVLSYRFHLNMDDNTFTVDEKDNVFGRYENDSILAFFDGYGYGIISFDKSSYSYVEFNYCDFNGIVEATFINKGTSFSYGNECTFVTSPFGNVMKTSNFDNNEYNDLVLENLNIIDGAIVRVNKNVFGKGTDSVVKKELLDNVQIITKDGEITDKASYVTTSFVSFSKPGFYEFSINIVLNGQTITSYYGIEILDSVYKDEAIIKNYDTGIIKSTGLVLDIFGRAYITYGADTYEGRFTINDDNTFTVIASNNGNVVYAVGSEIASGLIKLSCTGACNFIDYYTTGKVQTVASKDIALRLIVIDGVSYYFISPTINVLGDEKEVTLLEGEDASKDNVVLSFTNNDGKVVTYKIVTWGNLKDGMIIADSYIGIYKNDENGDLYLNGFGEGLYKNEKISYSGSGLGLTLVSKNNCYVVKINLDNKTYDVLDIKLDNTLLEGKTFSGSHQFICGGYPYTANTSFSFLENGKVLIKSTSDSHDSGEDACVDDIYDPEYASKDGVYGTFSVKANNVTITANGITFVFVINDVINVDCITCQSSTLKSGSHGEISVNTVFYIN